MQGTQFHCSTSCSELEPSVFLSSSYNKAESAAKTLGGAHLTLAVGTFWALFGFSARTGQNRRSEVFDFVEEFWSGRPGSNRRRPAWEAGILPLNYARSGNGSEEIYMGLHQACQCEVARSVFAAPAIFQSLLIVSIRRELTAEARRTRPSTRLRMRGY